jgi:hypothetical protein
MTQEIRDHRESWAALKTADGTFDHNKALTGDDLKEFVDQKLFPYLAGFKQKAESRQQTAPTPSNTRSVKSSTRYATSCRAATRCATFLKWSIRCGSSHRMRSMSFLTCMKPRSKTWATLGETAATPSAGSISMISLRAYRQTFVKKRASCPRPHLSNPKCRGGHRSERVLLPRSQGRPDTCAAFPPCLRFRRFAPKWMVAAASVAGGQMGRQVVVDVVENSCVIALVEGN